VQKSVHNLIRDPANTQIHTERQNETNHTSASLHITVESAYKHMTQCTVTSYKEQVAM